MVELAGTPIPARESESSEELERRVSELQLIFDAIPALVFYLDSAGRLVRANRAAQALGLGGPRQGGDPALSSETERARSEADLEALRRGRASLGAIEPFDVPERGRRWFEIARLPQFDEQGRVKGLVVVCEDITDRKQLESQLLQAQKLESIGRLAGGVAHDFNNLLTSFFGLIAAAQRSLPNDSLAHEYLALMQLAAEGGANFTKQLLAFARRQIIEPRIVDLNRLVRETSALLSRVLGARITIRLELSTDPVPVRVDPSQIAQLLMNLAINARDAMADEGMLTFRTGSVELPNPESWSLSASPSGRYALLVVEDTGEGLSDDAQEHLFEPFFTSKALGQGTGLGLATCYGIVKQNGGHIRVDSQSGVGTRFSIYLPEADAKLEPAPLLESPPRPVRAGTETILLAEDDDLVRYLAVAALASSGYRMIEAVQGEEALKATAEHSGPIHLLITDIIMPKMGGVELAQRFLELRPGARVLYISGYAGDALSAVGPNVEVLQKPFTSDALLARVREILDAPPVEAERDVRT